jgi:hypothetical protein
VIVTTSTVFQEEVGTKAAEGNGRIYKHSLIMMSDHSMAIGDFR